MASTDHELKKIFMERRHEFSEWMLEKELRDVTVEPTEQLPDEQATRPDLVFRVTTMDGRTIWLPIEFQGKTSKPPLPMRMLLTKTRLFRSHPKDLITGVVIYVGSRAGTNDTGMHHVYGDNGEPTITWKYKVIRLWDMDAEQFLAQAQKHPFLLVLIGQTRIKDPSKLVPQLIAQVKAIPDEKDQAEVLVYIQMLIHDRGILTMIQQHIETEGLFGDSPYLEQIRAAARQEVEEQLHEKEEQLHETQQRLHVVEEEKQRIQSDAEEKIRKLARRLLTIMGNEEISAETGLSLEEVQALRENQSV